MPSLLNSQLWGWASDTLPRSRHHFDQKLDDQLSQSQLDNLASKLSPSFSLYNVDELFLDDGDVGDEACISNVDISRFESEAGKKLKGSCGSALPIPANVAFDDDDDMDDEEKNLSDVEKRIQDEINASNTSFRIAMMSAASTPTKTPTKEPPANPNSSTIINLSSPMTPSLTSPHPMDSSFMKQMRRNR